MNTQVIVQVQRPIGKLELFLKVISPRMPSLRQTFGADKRHSHWEYTDEVGETSEVQPIPVSIGNVEIPELPSRKDLERLGTPVYRKPSRPFLL